MAFAAAQGLQATNDLQHAQQCSELLQKPILLTFTGYACVSSSDLILGSLPDPDVQALVKEHYLLTILYVDDRTQLLPEQQYYDSLRQRPVKTVGDRNSKLQTSTFQNNSQPYLVAVDAQLRPLAKPVGYSPTPEPLLAMLETGLRHYQTLPDSLRTLSHFEDQ